MSMMCEAIPRVSTSPALLQTLQGAITRFTTAAPPDASDVRTPREMMLDDLPDIVPVVHALDGGERLPRNALSIVSQAIAAHPAHIGELQVVLQEIINSQARQLE